MIDEEMIDETIEELKEAKQILVELQGEYAVLEKALELACKELRDWVSLYNYCKSKDCDNCPADFTCVDATMEFFIEKAEEELQND